MENNNIKSDVLELINELKEYISIRSTLLSLQIKKTSAELISSIGSSLILIIFASMAFIFGSFAFAYYLAEVFNSLSLGFLTVCGIYVFMLLLAYLMRNSIKTSISNTIISQMFKEDNYENDQE